MSIFFILNDTSTTEIYTLSLHDALPILWLATKPAPWVSQFTWYCGVVRSTVIAGVLVVVNTMTARSEEHTSELQSQFHLVCRLLLEKKKEKQSNNEQDNTVDKLPYRHSK